MAQVSLTNRPGPFKKKVEIPSVTGEKHELALTFKYRTRTELASLIDGYSERARARTQAMVEAVKAEHDKALQEYEAKLQAAKDAGDEHAFIPRPELKPIPEMEMADAMNEAGAEYILEVVEAWDLPQPLTTETAATLCDMYPAAPAVIAKDYAECIKEGRLGN